jgi:malate dehydrogenase (oxaloacetate-decarboxylating)
MPVMEGKAMLMETLVGLSGVPILLNTKDPDEIVQAVAAIAPTFAAIQLEDISAPRCFEIESRLQAMLDIPVMHDDQHGTAVVSTAALLVAAKRERRGPAESGHRADRAGGGRAGHRSDVDAPDRESGLRRGFERVRFGAFCRVWAVASPI